MCAFFLFRKIACLNCCNKGNRRLPPLYEICKIFQLHCEGKIVSSCSKLMSTNMQFVPASYTTLPHTAAKHFNKGFPRLIRPVKGNNEVQQTEKTSILKGQSSVWVQNSSLWLKPAIKILFLRPGITSSCPLCDPAWSYCTSLYTVPSLADT